MRKKIIYSISLILIILVSLYLGYFLTLKYNPPISLTVNPGEKNDLIRGWYIHLKGEIKEINPDYLILGSENKLENKTVKINISREGTRFYLSRSPEERSSLLKTREQEKISSTELFEIANQPAEFKDFKVGDKIFVQANLLQNKLSALTITKTQ